MCEHIYHIKCKINQIISNIQTGICILVYSLFSPLKEIGGVALLKEIGGVALLNEIGGVALLKEIGGVALLNEIGPRGHIAVPFFCLSMHACF